MGDYHNEFEKKQKFNLFRSRVQNEQCPKCGAANWAIQNFIDLTEFRDQNVCVCLACGSKWTEEEWDEFQETKNQVEENIVDTIIKKFGDETQDLILIEEMSELTKELLKRRRNKNNRNQIIEEMAHTYISLKVVQTILNIDDNELEKYVNSKKYELFYEKEKH